MQSEDLTETTAGNFLFQSTISLFVYFSCFCANILYILNLIILYTCNGENGPWSYFAFIHFPSPVSSVLFIFKNTQNNASREIIFSSVLP